MQLKKLNPAETTFYVFETSSTTFSLFDSQLDVAIYYGSWNMCEGLIKNIKKHMKSASILYYTKNKSGTLVSESAWSHKA
jgi:hypothetical protein